MQHKPPFTALYIVVALLAALLGGWGAASSFTAATLMMIAGHDPSEVDDWTLNLLLYPKNMGLRWHLAMTLVIVASAFVLAFVMRRARSKAG